MLVAETLIGNLKNCVCLSLIRRKENIIFEEVHVIRGISKQKRVYYRVTTALIRKLLLAEAQYTPMMIGLDH